MKRMLVVLLAVIVIGISGCSQGGGAASSPVVYLTHDYELRLIEIESVGVKANTFALAKFVPSYFSSYYNYDEDCVFYSSDGATLYYFQSGDDGGGPLYSVKVDDLNNEQITPTLIDDYVVMNRVETSYTMETFDDGGLLYMSWDYNEARYALKYYNGISSSTLLKGDEIYLTFNSNKTLANICVMTESEINDWTWYRMEMNGQPRVEYVCDGTLSCLDDLYSELDFQTMVDNDVILCVSHNDAEDGYYKIDLYIQGQWRETLVERFPWFSKGPFGISVTGNDVSFYAITTVDGLTTTGQYYEGNSERWNFYFYENGSFGEASEELRFEQNLPDNAVEPYSIYYLNDEVIFQYSTGSRVSLRRNGSNFEVAEIDEQLNPRGGFLLDVNGQRVLFGLNGQLDVLYAYSNGVLKTIAENVEHMNIYTKLDKKLLVAYGDGIIYSLNINNMDFNSIEKDMSVISIEDRFLAVVPYDNDQYLYISPYDDLWLWNGKKSERIWPNIQIMWSDFRRSNGNNPRIY
jgi:hypothetical protein